MTVYRACPDCKRQIAEAIYDRPSAHGTGCSVRRSLLAKACYQDRIARKERARKAAETRRQRLHGVAS